MTIAYEETWIPKVETFGARLALVRHAMGGWNMKEAADACGISESNWRGWETKGRTPRNIAEVALQISEHTNGVDDYWLATGREKAPRPAGPDEGLPSNVHPLGLEPRTH